MSLSIKTASRELGPPPEGQDTCVFLEPLVESIKRHHNRFYTPGLSILCLFAAQFAFAADSTPSPAPAPAPTPAVQKSAYGTMPDGTPVEMFTLTNKNGAVANVIGYGATIVELDMPDRAGKFANVVLGTDSLAAYQRFAQQAFVAGRVANRIAGAKFTLDGKEYTLNANNGPNTLHG
ncbi:MAG: hypothetical protein ACREIC_07095, partial [Limisphaerales bacterium]